MGLHGKVLVVGGYRSGFCEKLQEASPMSSKASASQLWRTCCWPRPSKSATVV